ncbi:MAG: hypothetical protein ABI604_17480, partial [Nitrospirota bacterium]
APYFAKPVDSSQNKTYAHSSIHKDEVTRDVGLSRNSLYKSLSSERSSGFDIILIVVGALGVEIAR